MTDNKKEKIDCPCEKCHKNGLFMNCLKEPQPIDDTLDKEFDEWISQDQEENYNFEREVKSFIRQRETRLKLKWKKEVRDEVIEEMTEREDRKRFSEKCYVDIGAKDNDIHNNA